MKNFLQSLKTSVHLFLFYIEKIKGFLNSIKLSEKYKAMSESGDYGKKSMKKDRGGSFPSLAEYNYALQIINDYPYEVVK